MRAVEGWFAGPLISLHGSACAETEPAILIAVIIWRHYIGESGGKISSPVATICAQAENQATPTDRLIAAVLYETHTGLWQLAL